MKTRSDLAKLVPAGGRIIELGVAAGEFAAQLLTANPAVRYTGVDRWNDHHNIEEMETARARLHPWADRVETVRHSFADYSPFEKDESADLIYIDGYAHTGQEGGQTLRDWWPKVKPGGIFAGHDYSGHYPQTIAAVDAFMIEMGLELRIIDEKPHPSWWTIKPNPAKP
jgi:predicted O-methyltransferase YrrM